MGLDAFVPCNCFEKGRLPKPPDPLEADDLFRDEDGCISSHKLVKEYKRLGYQEYRARYGDIENLLNNWAERSCEHEDGEYFSESVSNWSGVARFESVVEELGGSERYPILSNLIPEGNGGSFPASQAPEAIREIDDLIAAASKLVFNVLACEDSDDPVWTCADCATSLMMMGPSVEVGMSGDAVYFIVDGRTYTSKRFRQEPAGPADASGSQPMDVTLSETGERIRVFDSIGPRGASKVVREFWVEQREAPFMYEGHYYAAERIRSLLVASAETGNSIYWC